VDGDRSGLGALSRSSLGALQTASQCRRPAQRRNRRRRLPALVVIGSAATLATATVRAVRTGGASLGAGAGAAAVEVAAAHGNPRGYDLIPPRWGPPISRGSARDPSKLR
jgi:hypothetical protein